MPKYDDAYYERQEKVLRRKEKLDREFCGRVQEGDRLIFSADFLYSTGGAISPFAWDGGVVTDIVDARDPRQRMVTLDGDKHVLCVNLARPGSLRANERQYYESH